MFLKFTKAMMAMASALVLSASLYAVDVAGGVFLSTITDAEGNLLSRSLVTFNADGTTLVSDSDQQGEGGPDGFPPFSLQQGYWVENCDTILLKTVDFQFPKFVTCDGAHCCDDQLIVVSNIELRNECDQLEADDIILSFFALDADINNDEPLFVVDTGEQIVLSLISKPEATDTSCSSSSSSSSSSSDDVQVKGKKMPKSKQFKR